MPGFMKTFSTNAGGSAMVLALVVVMSPTFALADEVQLAPDRDTSLFSEGGDLSNGVGAYLFAGQIRSGEQRRALLAFDCSGIPAGSTVTAVMLALHVSQAPPAPQVVALAAHRVLGAWGEGSSDSGTPGGGGITAEPGDATWTQRVVPSALWTTPGGDFSLSASGSADLVETDSLIFATAPGLVADVQGWIEDAATNRGWILLTPQVAGSARRFDSRENENPAFRPVLTITYTPPAPTCPADLDDGSGTGTPDGGVDVNDLLYFLVQFEAGSDSADLDNGSGTGVPDGGVDINDLLFFLARFEGGC